MNLLAAPSKKAVDASQLIYLKQGFDIHTQQGIGSEQAQYDACHYVVTMDQSILEKWDPTKLNLKITKKSTDLNVYVWKGPSRTEAKESLISNN